MKILICLSTLTSFLMILANHPMLMIALISSQAAIICLILSMILQTPWFSFILFLVFMGGLMVLFIYISSLASNENFNFKLNSMSMTLLTSLIIFTAVNIMINEPIKFLEMNMKQLIFKIYSPSMMMITILTMIYLLLVLIIIVNTIMLKEGSLRNMN